MTLVRQHGLPSILLRRREEPGRALCLESFTGRSSSQGPFGPALCVAGVARAKARWGSGVVAQESEAGTPQEHVATACPGQRAREG